MTGIFFSVDHRESEALPLLSYHSHIPGLANWRHSNINVVMSCRVDSWCRLRGSEEAVLFVSHHNLSDKKTIIPHFEKEEWGGEGFNPTVIVNQFILSLNKWVVTTLSHSNTVQLSSPLTLAIDCGYDTHEELQCSSHLLHFHSILPFAFSSR
jgi:hypothetical protein